MKFLKRLDLFLFYLLVITIPFEKRHVFETSISRFEGQFIEWRSMAFYLSDIFLVAVIVIWLGKWLLVKISNSSLPQQIKKGNQSEFSGEITRNLIICFTIFIICGLISTLISNFVKLALYHVIKLIEFGLLFFYLIKNINTIKKIIFTLFCFIGTGFIQAILGILQYLKQNSLGLKMLGEVDLSPTIQNVAKIVVNGQKLIRAYGTFPHSNVLAGFLFVAIVFTFVFIILILHQRSFLANFSQKTTDVPRGTFFMPFIRFSVFHVEHFKLFGLNMPNFIVSLPFFIFVFCILFLGLLLTFSRTAWFVLIISLAFFVFFLSFLLPNFIKSIVYFFRSVKLSQLSSIFALILFIILCVVIFWPQIFARTATFDQYGDVTISGRLFYDQIAFQMIQNYPIFGIGPGLFVVKMADFMAVKPSWWQLQPVHNIYLLILSEFGFLGFSVFLMFLCYILVQVRKVSLSTSGNFYIAQVIFIALSSIFLGFLIIMFFDHYLWTIQQGSLIFWLVLGLLMSLIFQFKRDLLKSKL